MSYNFNAILSSTSSNATGDGTSVDLVCDQILLNENGVYNNSTGKMTCVATTNFVFQGNVCLGGLTALHTSILVELVTPQRVYNVFDSQGLALNSSVYNINFTQIAFIEQEEETYIRVTVDGSFKTVDILGDSSLVRTSFGGILP